MKPFLTAQWRNLVFVNYEIDPTILKPYIPAGTELDFYNGKCYVSLVAFKFVDTKVHGFSIPFNKNFEELNLRFYVRCKQNGQWKRGVVFAKEVVGKRLVLQVANTFYGEHFYYHPINSIVTENESNNKVVYNFKVNDSWDNIEVLYDKESAAATAGSLAEFMIEHYWGFTKLDNGNTGEYRITREPWRMHAAQAYNINMNTEPLYGARLHKCFGNKPVSVFVVDGSPVTMYKRSVLDINA